MSFLVFSGSPARSASGPKGPKGAFGALGGDGPMGPFGVTLKPFRMESHFETQGTQGDPGVISGPRPLRYSKWTIFISFCLFAQFRAQGRPDAPNDSFWYHFWYYFGPVRAQGRPDVQMESFFGGHFGLSCPDVQMVSFDAMLDNFKLKACYFGSFLAQDRPDAPNDQVWYHFGSFRAQGRTDVPNDQFWYHFG